LSELYGLKSVFISTYQSVSGAGQKGIDELSSQVSDLFNGKDTVPNVFPQRIAFNLVPQIGSFSPDGFTQEEIKMIFETRKILNLPNLDIEVTAVRVPVFFSHAETLMIELDREADLDVLKSEIEEHNALELMDDFETLLYPTPADSVGNDAIFIGRLRYGNNGTNKKRINAWLVADNVRKGAALNGIEIAEKILEVF
jgi:aspartate-semialdehyde dehydrogenase